MSRCTWAVQPGDSPASDAALRVTRSETCMDINKAPGPLQQVGIVVCWHLV